MKGNRKTLSQGVDPSVNSSHLSKKKCKTDTACLD